MHFLWYLCDRQPHRFPLGFVKEAYERARDQYERDVDRQLSRALRIMELGDDCPVKPCRQALAGVISALGDQEQLGGYGMVGLPVSWVFTRAPLSWHFEENTPPEEFAKYALRSGSVLEQMMTERDTILDEELQSRVN